MPISLFSIEKDSEAVSYIEKAIQFNSTNKCAERTWDFSDISAMVERLKPSQCTLIKDLISLIQNETTYPTIRFDQINIEQEDAGNYAEVSHPFVGHKTIRKGDDSLKMIMKNLGKGDVDIDIDKSTIMDIERDIALMTLGFLYKKQCIDFMEITPNNLRIRLTDSGKKVVEAS